MVKYIDKPSVKDKLRWLLTHNKNYTKEQIYTLSDLEDQINDILKPLEYVLAVNEFYTYDKIMNIIKTIKGE